ncbi:MAG: CehA/McbA family metallohydrolase [Streptosporangiaceae bacterium]
MEVDAYGGEGVTSTTHRGRWTPEDKADGSYHYLPVDVPAGAESFSVRLSYDSAAGVLDLGCVGPGGFRGWSGSARRGYVIGRAHATPGYLPGALEAGTWHVLLGLHRVPPEGVSYEVVAETDGKGPEAPTLPVVPPSERPPRRELPASPGQRWLAGDLHAHTVHSDGAATPAELAGIARGQGLDFLAVTDHNTVSHHADLAKAGAHAGVLLLPGQEMTTERGHANAFGDVGWIDFREPAETWFAETEKRGGLLSVNHPICADCSWLHPMPRRPPLAEVWHASWLDRRWSGPLAWWYAWDDTVVPVGGSDWHGPASHTFLGQPTTWVECGDGDVLAGLRAGRVALSADYEGPVLLRCEGELVVVGADGAFLVDREGRRRRVRGELARFAGTPGPYRLEDDTSATLALTP